MPPTSASFGPAGAFLAVAGLALGGVDRFALRSRAAAGRKACAVRTDADVPGRDVGRRDRLAELRRLRRGAWRSTGDDAPRRLRDALSIDIGRLPLLVDAPALDRIVVIDCPRRPRSAMNCRARRLHHAGVVGGAALQHGRTAVPLPRRAEAHRRLRQDRALQRRRRPALAAVGRDLDLADAAVARPGEAGDLVEARALQREARATAA